jgi:hypothetical protein
MAVARFLSTPIGRIIRALAGLGLVVGVVGLMPMAAATFNICLIGPFVGGYLDGRKNLEGGR